MKICDFRQDKRIIEFIELINHYCNVIDKRNELTLSELVIQLLPLLQRIIELIEELPKVDNYFEDDKLSSIIEEYVKNRKKEFPLFCGFPLYISTEEWKNIFYDLRKKFGKYDRHDDITEEEFSKYKKYDLLLNSSLSDDLADIYRDLKSELIKNDIQRPELLLNAIYYWGDINIAHTISHLCGAIYGLSIIKNAPNQAQEPT
jgi:hypothetical protein